MKIKFIVNSIDYVEDDIKKAVSYLEEMTPLKIEYDIEVVNLTVEHVLFFRSPHDNRFWMGSHKLKEQLRPIVDEHEYHAVCFIYDRSKSLFYGVEDFVVASWSFWKPLYPTTEYTEVATDKSTDNNDWTWKLISHELIHSFVKRAARRGRTVKDEMDETTVKGKKVTYYMNHDPYAKNGNYARTLANLEPHWDMVEYQPYTAYKYFNKKEAENMNHEFMLILDKARGIAGIPFSINSGYRTPAENKEVGGVADSSHLSGLAVDLRARNPEELAIIHNALYDCGIRRFGISDTFIHADADPSKPSPRIWLY